MDGDSLSKKSIKNFINTEEQEETKENTKQSFLQRSVDKVVDVVVIGCGPAGLALARSLSERKLQVVCIDPHIDKPWKNNYGVWLDRMESLQLADCLSPVWSNTRVHIDNNRTRLLPFAYGKVDRNRMKQKLLNVCKESGVVFFEDSVANIIQEPPYYSCITSQQGKFTCRLVVDATGHFNTFVKFDTPHDPGFQVAYGIDVEVSGHPFPIDEMLLMDFRDSHMQDSLEDKTQSFMFPTFLYAMPMSGTRVFLEETSLISKPPLSFEHLKQRLFKRLRFLRIEIKHIFEEEFCMIPMGGSMPSFSQNVLGFGGSAGMVHPATGYMFSRVMEMAPILAKSIENSLLLFDDKALSKNTPLSIWNELWSHERTLQRDMRDFFWAFFMLPDKEWKEFLDFDLTSSRKRLLFGLRIFSRTSPALRLSLIKEAILNGRLKLLKSVVL
ncbi:Lycopene beta cyclase, chloroplastic [Galdieria sulphuraria]|nr:Lycopene beta cyclase, chloroplastic [Galdieria sulphuraria]